MKEFIIKDDEIKLRKLKGEIAEDFKFVTNDTKENVKSFRGGGRFNIPTTVDNRIKKNIISSNIKEYDITHNNYINYLDSAYSGDYGIVIKPDFIWFTILCELADTIKNDPETFRDYFSYTTEKQDIIFHFKEVGVLPVDDILKKIIERIPSNITEDLISPNFTTKDEDSDFAFKSTFLDVVSPFYGYMGLWCGYNKIKILGEQSDYLLITQTLNKIVKTIPQFSDYSSKVENAINDIIENWDDVEFWKNVCKTESGYGTRNVDGWFRDFFIKKIGSLSSFPQHLTMVDYRDCVFGNEYSLYVGILSSKLEDGYLVPSFNKIVAQKETNNLKLEITTKDKNVLHT